MIKAIMEVAVQKVCFTTVGSDRGIVIPESRDCGNLFVEHLDGFPKFFVGGELQIAKVLLFVPT